MILATDTYLRVANDDTKVMTGHGAARDEGQHRFNAMLKTALSQQDR